jgi:hypothetical protein
MAITSVAHATANAGIAETDDAIGLAGAVTASTRAEHAMTRAVTAVTTAL